MNEIDQANSRPNTIHAHAIVAAIFAFGILLAVISVWSHEPIKPLHREAEGIASDWLRQITAIGRQDGPDAVLEECGREHNLVETRHGNLWVSCGVIATFYDPRLYRVRNTINDTILPVSARMRLEQGQILLQRGYTYMNPAVFVFVYDQDPYAGFPPLYVAKKEAAL